MWLAQVQLFRWVEKDDGVQELQTECGYHGHILALYMQVECVGVPLLAGCSCCDRVKPWHVPAV